MEKAELTLLFAVIGLLTASSLLSELTFTGNILNTESCGPLGCLEACDSSQDCVTGLSCCQTAWGTGLCDRADNCDAIAIFTRTHTPFITGAVPARMMVDQRSDAALVTLISMIVISVVFILLWFVYRMPTQRMQRTTGGE
jgi:hypothetical protein